MSTQWAAQFLVAGELERVGYVVTFTMGHATPVADLMVGHPNGGQFWIDVKGLATRNAWLGKAKAARRGLFYVGVLVGRSRIQDEFFVMTQANWNDLVDGYQARHPNQKKIGGFGWKDAAPFKDRWDILPDWASASG